MSARDFATAVVVHTETEAYFAQRHAQLEAGVLTLLRPGVQRTATELRHALNAGMREIARVLQSMRTRGLIRSQRRRWDLVS